MDIRSACSKDVKAIASIVSASTIARDSTAISGLVEYPPLSEEQYARRIHNNPYFLVAEVDGVFAGFVSGYDSATVRSPEFDNDPVATHFRSHALHFVYLDQLVVAQNNQRQKVGSQLFAAVERQAGDTMLFCAIARPEVESASKKFASRNGWLQGATFRTPTGLNFVEYSKRL